MLFVTTAFQPKEVLDAGSKAADTLTQTVLGSLVVVFIITTGVALWLAWRAKQGEIATIKDLVNANADEKMAAKELAMAQVKAYEELAEAVEAQGQKISNLEGALQGTVAGSAMKITDSVDKLGKRIDSLANSSEGVSAEKYYSGRD